MKNTIEVSKILFEAIENVFQYASHISDWLVIKKEILKSIPVEARSLFSQRDPITKKQRVNELEKSLAQFWSTKTKKPVEMPDEN